jgi:hypothetical protein
LTTLLAIAKIAHNGVNIQKRIICYFLDPPQKYTTSIPKLIFIAAIHQPKYKANTFLIKYVIKLILFFGIFPIYAHVIYTSHVNITKSIDAIATELTVSKSNTNVHAILIIFNKLKYKCVLRFHTFLNKL